MAEQDGAQPELLAAPDRLLHSDPHDFAGLYIRHRASFTLHARRYLRDARDADEVVQEAFLRLFLALPELETELQALAYCRRTITNLCIDRYRAQARRPSLVDLDSAGAMDLAEEDHGDPVVRAEDAAIVREALSLLSPLHRAALVKREIEEKPVPVIAQELDIPEENVKHVLFRARRALRRILATTSLAPGSDAEIAGALGKAVRAGSSGVAAFLMLLFLGLGTGPDLRAIPVVGTDLPALIPVEQLANAMGSVVTNVASAVADSDAEEPVAQQEPDLDAPEPVPAPDPSQSSASSPSATSTGTSSSPTTSAAASPVASASAPEPTVAAAPTAPDATPSTGTDESPSPESSPTSSPEQSPDTTSPSPSPSPTASAAASPSSSPSAKPGRSGPDRRTESRPTEEPTAEPTAAS